MLTTSLSRARQGGGWHLLVQAGREGQACLQWGCQEHLGCWVQLIKGDVVHSKRVNTLCTLLQHMLQEVSSQQKVRLSALFSL